MKIQRLIAILTILLRTDHVSARRLAEKFEVSTRTIYRDIHVLEQAGIPIVSAYGLNGGIGIIEEYKIDKKLFTSQDISMLLTALNTVSGSVSASTLNQTLEKIRALIPKEHAQAVEVDARKLHIDMTPWANNPAIGENLGVLRQALDGNHMVSFLYTNLKEETAPRKVEPHQLMLKDSQWYLKAYCMERQDFRTFKLLRMQDIQAHPEVFEPRDFPQETPSFKEWSKKGMIKIELLADSSIRDFLLEQCSELDMRPADNGKIHVTINFVVNELLYSYLLQFGDKCECIAPPHVRQEVIRRLDSARRMYGGFPNHT